jgi:RNA polymerase sigma factor (sigma-70 family)
MVLGVCRRLLADPSDVEDAFQATFLILVRRAGSIRSRDRLAPWLFGVARKVASRTRTDLARRRSKEVAGADEIAEADDPFDRELNQALFEEIDRLPDSLREPILLCCVEGLSYEEAATRMESTAPAVRGRLARARDQLKARLTRRGFTPSAVSAGGMLAGTAIRVVLPSKLLMMTTIPLAKAGALPAGVEILAEGVIRTMIATKSKILFAGLLTCGVAASGAGVYAKIQATPEETQPATVIEARADETLEVSPLPAAIDPEATEPQQSPDRLGQLEKKLDRLIEVLEAPNRNVATGRTFYTLEAAQARPAAPPTEMNTQARPAGQPLVAQPVPPQPPAYPPPGTIDPTTGRPVGAARPSASRSSSDSDPNRARTRTNPEMPNDTTRIQALENNLGRLEARIANIERKLNLRNPFEPINERDSPAPNFRTDDFEPTQLDPIPPATGPRRSESDDLEPIPAQPPRPPQPVPAPAPQPIPSSTPL